MDIVEVVCMAVAGGFAGGVLAIGLAVLVGIWPRGE